MNISRSRAARLQEGGIHVRARVEVHFIRLAAAGAAPRRPRNEVGGAHRSARAIKTRVVAAARPPRYHLWALMGELALGSPRAARPLLVEEVADLDLLVLGV